MIIYLENKHTLRVDDFKFKCCIGKRGLTINKKEGDKKTPRGLFGIGKLYYRKDRINKLNTKLNIFPITKNMIWEDNPHNKNYNMLTFNNKKSYEKLFRKDNIYDIIIVINYNNNPIVPGKGSAIFMHVAKNNYFPTRGCIALQKKDLIFMISKLSVNEQILISF